LRHHNNREFYSFTAQKILSLRGYSVNREISGWVKNGTWVWGSFLCKIKWYLSLENKVVSVGHTANLGEEKVVISEGFPSEKYILI